MIQVSIALNAASIICGLFSAWYWLRSSRVPFPDLTYDGGNALRAASLHQGHLSGIGARWAAASMTLLAIDNLAKLAA